MAPMVELVIETNGLLVPIEAEKEQGPQLTPCSDMYKVIYV